MTIHVTSENTHELRAGDEVEVRYKSGATMKGTLTERASGFDEGNLVMSLSRGTYRTICRKSGRFELEVESVTILNRDPEPPPCPFPIGAKVRRKTGSRKGTVTGWREGPGGRWVIQLDGDYGGYEPEGFELVPEPPAVPDWLQPGRPVRQGDKMFGTVVGAPHRNIGNIETVGVRSRTLTEGSVWAVQILEPWLEPEGRAVAWDRHNKLWIRDAGIGLWRDAAYYKLSGAELELGAGIDWLELHAERGPLHVVEEPAKVT